MDRIEIEELLFEYVEHIKVLVSPETWNNVLLDCSKNEVLILVLLYQKEEVNMTQIAQYINVPLNTATGIVTRMEKRQMVYRKRNQEDKRVVTIGLAAYGKEQIQNMIKETMYYVQKIMSAFTQQELQLVRKIVDKSMQVLKEEHETKVVKVATKIKKITIE